MRAGRLIVIGAAVFVTVWLAAVVGFFNHGRALTSAKVSWTHPLPDNSDQVPDILSDGTIVCTGAGYINWLSPDGELLARRDVAGTQRSALPGGSFSSMMLNFCYAAGAGDLCYYCVGSVPGQPAVLHAVDKTGTDAWSYSFTEASALNWIVFNDTHVFVLLENGGLAKLTLAGEKVWYQPPATYPPSLVLAGLEDSFYTLNSSSQLSRCGPDGKPLWTCQLTSAAGVNAADLGPDGTVYLTDWYLAAEAVSPAGKSLWRTTLERPSGSTLMSSLRMMLPFGSGGFGYGGWMQEDPDPAAAPGGGVVVSASDSVARLAADGSVRWKRFGGGTAGTPAVAPDGRVYVAFANGGLRCYDPDGQLQWRNTGIETFESDPIVGKDGRVLIEGDGKLWCFEK